MARRVSMPGLSTGTGPEPPARPDTSDRLSGSATTNWGVPDAGRESDPGIHGPHPRDDVPGTEVLE